MGYFQTQPDLPSILHSMLARGAAFRVSSGVAGQYNQRDCEKVIEHSAESGLEAQIRRASGRRRRTVESRRVFANLSCEEDALVPQHIKLVSLCLDKCKDVVKGRRKCRKLKGMKRRKVR